jgi:hypothetical protein
MNRLSRNAGSGNLQLRQTASGNQHAISRGYGSSSARRSLSTAANSLPREPDAPVFRPVAAPESSDLQGLVEQIAGGIGRALERPGLVGRELENAWLATDTEGGPLIARNEALGCQGRE